MYEYHEVGRHAVKEVSHRHLALRNVIRQPCEGANAWESRNREQNK